MHCHKQDGQAFLLRGGRNSLYCASCNVTLLLVMLTSWVIRCILLCTMAFGGLQGGFIQLFVDENFGLDIHMKDRKTRWPIFPAKSAACLSAWN